MAIHHYSFPTRIAAGAGAIKLVPDTLKEAARARPLVVTDRGLAALPVVADTVKLLTDAGFATAVFSGVWGNPVKSQVAAGVAAYEQHRADSVVALGGGAALDVAKAIALMAHHPGDLFDYEDGKPDARAIDRELPLILTIPTTAGTGSEVGRSTVVSDDATHVKKIIFSPRLLAARAFLDPDLTMALPAPVTAATGMDALTHLVEAYLAKGFHPLADGVALEGLRLCAQALPLAVDFARRVDVGDKALLADERHREARFLMLHAAMMGAVAFQKGLGVTHSCAHALSTVCDLHHGLANGVMIPYAMAFNRDAAGARLAQLAVAVGATPATADGFIAWLKQVQAAVGIPATLPTLGVRPEHLDRLVAIAVADACHPNNPRAVTADDFRALFVAALGQGAGR